MEAIAQPDGGWIIPEYKPGMTIHPRKLVTFGDKTMEMSSAENLSKIAIACATIADHLNDLNNEHPHTLQGCYRRQSRQTDVPVQDRHCH